PTQLEDSGYQKLGSEGNWEAPIPDRCVNIGSPSKMFEIAGLYLRYDSVCDNPDDAKWETKEYPKDFGTRIGGRSRCLFSVQD
ncbi:hypothetical protein BGZ96_003549, partial [Linnemannia gamsii]